MNIGNTLKKISQLTLAKSCFASIHWLGGRWVAAFIFIKEQVVDQRIHQKKSMQSILITVMPSEVTQWSIA